MRRDAQRPTVDVERLLSEYRKNPDPAIIDRVVEAHLYIAAIIARRFSGRGVDYDDLYQVASLALYKSIERYDPERGVKFASFVTPTMVGEVKNYFRDRSRAIRLPRRGAKLMQDIERAREELVQQMHRQPTADELADMLDVPLEDVIEALEMRGAASPVSLDSMPQEDDDAAPLSNFFGVSEQGYIEFERNDMLRRAMSTLNEQHRDVIRMRYFENRSQREVAEELGVSQMWVSRAERKALELMKEMISGPED